MCKIFRVSLIGFSIFVFSLVKHDALERRKVELRKKKEITERVIADAQK